MPNTHLADFHGYPIEIVDHNGQQWVTAEQIGIALGYPQHNARKRINRLFTRNEDEFESCDVGGVKLTTPGGVQEVRVFSASGCVLISMFSGAERAKQFRAWAKKTLTEEQAQVSYHQHQALKDALLSAQPDHAKLIRYTEMGLQPAEIGKLLSITPSAVRHRQVKLEKLGLLTRNVNPALSQAGKKGYQVMQLKRLGGDA